MTIIIHIYILLGHAATVKNWRAIKVAISKFKNANYVHIMESDTVS